MNKDIKPEIRFFKDNEGLMLAGGVGILRRLPSGKLGTVLLCAHIGPSMNPILCHLDLLEIVPYGNRPIRVGDVILFMPPNGSSPIIHRVVGVTSEGIRTRGDSNNRDDPWTTQPADITGRVIAACRGQKKRRIMGGPVGRLAGYLIRWRRALDRGVSQILHPVYRSLARHGIMRHLLPNCFRPRVVIFEAGSRSHLRLLLGGRVVGQYDAHRRQWLIQRPFRLFIDEFALPDGREIEATRPL